MSVRNNIVYSFSFVLLSINLSFISKCTAPIKKEKDLLYNLSAPGTKYILKHNLSEVSGLSFISDNEVALIEDESGTLFYFNLEKGVITNSMRFAKDGDYEDLKILDDTVYIIRSDGTLFELKNFKGASSEMIKTKYNTGLGKHNNTEGLCYDDKRKLLLISCKGRPDNDIKHKNFKAIYAFNLVTKSLSDTPLVLIDVNEVENMVSGIGKNIIQKYMSFYRNSKPVTFQPSGIAIHPFTRDLYLISSVGNLLVIVDTLGHIKKAVKLASSVFKQPEGIAFDSKGNLFISNEGRKGKGNILKFFLLKD